MIQDLNPRHSTLHSDTLTTRPQHLHISQFNSIKFRISLHIPQKRYTCTCGYVFMLVWSSIDHHFNYYHTLHLHHITVTLFSVFICIIIIIITTISFYLFVHICVSSVLSWSSSIIWWIKYMYVCVLLFNFKFIYKTFHSFLWQPSSIQGRDTYFPFLCEVLRLTYMGAFDLSQQYECLINT